MNNTVKYLHPGLAHAYPMLADHISDFQGSRNNLTVYPATPLDDSDYNSPLDAFTKFLNFMIEFEESIKEVIQQSIDTNDGMTEEFLRHFLRKLNKYTEQTLLLVDKAESYGSNWMDFDRDIEKFFIL
jgi:ferritin